ncbi:G-D-S-L family lipolytic protein [Oleiphilus messinensis]|uniref:G-D-S-L family lipolytic protein n=1 Tax=Oleiphilus messinensis TaxID=141451 RepID=A0A1Y0IBA6_9GAMM|nr:arylesterase [Oleiphilus messinensis]ARU57787.1 G-D-S-L family lipolytic protein [Oleiphilus messinensis]
MKTLLIFLLPVLLTSCSDPELSRLTRFSTILAFGDSLTHGTGVKIDKSYPAVLAEMINIPVINAGVPGETSAEGLKRLPQLIAEHQPDLVILCHGGNDILRKLSRTQAKTNIAAMIQQIQQSGAEVVLIGVPEFGLTAPTGKHYIELAEELNLVADNDILSYLEKRNQFKSDSVHFNEAGYREMAGAIESLLRDHGAL